MNYKNATLADGSRVTLYARGNEGDVLRAGSSGLVKRGTVVARVRFSFCYYLV